MEQTDQFAAALGSNQSRGNRWHRQARTATDGFAIKSRKSLQEQSIAQFSRFSAGPIDRRRNRRDDRLLYVTSHRRQPGLSPLLSALIEPLIAVGEPLVVEAQLVEHGGVEIADMDWVFDDVVREIVGFAVNRARL